MPVSVSILTQMTTGFIAAWSSKSCHKRHGNEAVVNTGLCALCVEGRRLLTTDSD
jgi:hypothetical protein